MRKEIPEDKIAGVRQVMIDLGYWGDEEDVDAELKRRAEEKNTLTIEDNPVSNEDQEEEDDDRELFTGSRLWAEHFFGFWMHIITWKIIAGLTFTFTVAHLGAATIWRVERASLYNTVGKEVRLDYREKLACHLGYCLWLQRHDLSVDAPTLAEQVEEMKAEERKRFGLSKQHQQEWHLPVTRTKPAPDILGELNMKGPSGH
jgi:hypothetical protein